MRQTSTCLEKVGLACGGFDAQAAVAMRLMLLGCGAGEEDSIAIVTRNGEAMADAVVDAFEAAVDDVVVEVCRYFGLLDLCLLPTNLDACRLGCSCRLKCLCRLAQPTYRC